MAKVMYLPLAEKMLDKFVKDNRMNALAELRLLIMVLEMVGKPEQVLRVLEGPLGMYIQYVLTYTCMCDYAYVAEVLKASDDLVFV